VPHVAPVATVVDAVDLPGQHDLVFGHVRIETGLDQALLGELHAVAVHFWEQWA